MGRRRNFDEAHVFKTARFYAVYGSGGFSVGVRGLYYKYQIAPLMRIAGGILSAVVAKLIISNVSKVGVLTLRT